MAERFVHCAGRTELTTEQAELLRRVDPRYASSGVDDFSLAQWCELSNGHDGVPHHSEVMSLFEGDNWWLRWGGGQHELVILAMCPVESGPPDEVSTYPCGLFLGHPAQHDWEVVDPESCAHAGLGTPVLICEGVSYDKRYIAIFEAPCLGCPERMVQVSAVDAARARPPEHLGARTSQWSLYGEEE
ncbi:hypothetical protein [Streptomyces sp. NPDC059788]|uniref:hypothetical protein n=1 Tax=Streptomyces sp. NPDC059788 TaxID=3346948 RepID=UPI0036628B71